MRVVQEKEQSFIRLSEEVDYRTVYSIRTEYYNIYTVYN